jgi:hypothetical protein
MEIHVLTEEKLTLFRNLKQTHPHKILHPLALQSKVSKISAKTATEFLKLQPYKVRVIQEFLCGKQEACIADGFKNR